jgi:hypothetical protein
MKLSNLFSSSFQLLIVLALFTLACNAPVPEVKEEIGDPVALICLPEKGNTFRGLALGASPADLYSAIGHVPEQSSDTLVIESIGSDESDYNARIYYSFDAYGLFEIQADLFANDQAKLKESVTEFKSYFTEKFGESECKGSACRWTTFSINNNTVEVTLSDESSDVEVPFVSINFLEPLSDEF